MDLQVLFDCLRKLSLCAVLLASGLIHSQSEKDQTIYLDSLERPTTKDAADYMRVIVGFYDENVRCNVNDFYLSGARKMTGVYANKFSRSKTGPFLTYYENGKLKSQLLYENNAPVGKCYFWYENGNKKAECDYLESRAGTEPVLRINQFWSRIGIQRVVNGNGHFTDEDVTSFSEGELKNGLKHGLWWGTDYKDNFTFAETYKKGKLISGVSTDSLQQTHPYEKIFIDAEPKKGFDHLDAYFQDELGKHKDLQQGNEKLTVNISFAIQSDGKISDFEMLDYDNPKTGEVLLEIFRKYGPWLPAQSRGINTDTYFSVPITIHQP
jgi:antitoxin component YwqK of YwqJK toxin-antitoxin module